MKRLLCVALALLVLFSSLTLFSCKKDEGVCIEEYTIVIPENADLSTKYSAECLSSLLFEKTGKTVGICLDSEPEREKEILLGETSREESQISLALDNGQYTIFTSEDKIVLRGYEIYIGSACYALASAYGAISGDKIYTSKLPSEPCAYTYSAPNAYSSVIFMIGDGMGEAHIQMAEEKAEFSFIAKSFPSKATSITRSLSVINGDASFTDSAASATAMATGYKTINGYIGIDKDLNPLKNVRELAHEQGAKTAVISTDLITGATPSSYMCHDASRDNDEALTEQINALVQSGAIDYCQGDVGDELTTHTKTALNQISQNNSAFFVMIEEGIIDKKAHSKDAQGVIDTVKRFNDAIAYATQFTLMHPEVALIVTADHETGNLVPTTPGKYYFGSFNHTNKNVPIFALGAGTAELNEQKIENTVLAQFCARAYSSAPFGDSTVYE
ncbi:MAG: alkaline phosphatase [Clostridia bacterium]|nr:alkaline phosphatase [Clostridia bacterium]